MRSRGWPGGVGLARPVPPPRPHPLALDPHDARDLPLLPESIRTAILEQCRRGDLPRLPHALEAVVRRLRVEDDGEDYGEIPQPGEGLSNALAAAGSSGT
ncbi:hypothetical protein ACFZBU_38570 [Embleya sp. NPDC008237]|uniref:hypothetical protein n=1 Tax=Embleya sp. NPDC008237 TaxID=3363978 RepID=UPI0036E314AC